MENISTDSQSQRVKQESVSYWLTIDTIKMERSGEPLRYHNAEELSNALGVERDYEHKLLWKLRKRLAK